MKVTTPNVRFQRPEALLDQLEAAGAMLTRDENGLVKVSRAKVSDELLAALREQRAAVIEAWEQRRRADRDRYGRVPPPDAPMLARVMDLPELWKQKIMAHVLRQPRPVHAWVMARANDYYERGVKADDCEWRAGADVIAWQRMCGAREAAEFVVELPTDDELRK